MLISADTRAHPPHSAGHQYCAWLQFPDCNQGSLKLGGYVVTEAGFGSDLGPKNSLILCRKGGLKPNATVRYPMALKMHGNVTKEKLGAENVQAVKEGITNLKDMFRTRNLACRKVALNRFTSDTDAEVASVLEGVAGKMYRPRMHPLGRWWYRANPCATCRLHN